MGGEVAGKWAHQYAKCRNREGCERGPSCPPFARLAATATTLCNVEPPKLVERYPGCSFEFLGAIWGQLERRTGQLFASFAPFPSPFEFAFLTRSMRLQLRRFFSERKNGPRRTCARVSRLGKLSLLHRSLLSLVFSSFRPIFRTFLFLPPSSRLRHVSGKMFFFYFPFLLSPLSPLSLFLHLIVCVQLQLPPDALERHLWCPNEVSSLRNCVDS